MVSTTKNNFKKLHGKKLNQKNKGFSRTLTYIISCFFFLANWIIKITKLLKQLAVFEIPLVCKRLHGDLKMDLKFILHYFLHILYNKLVNFVSSAKFVYFLNFWCALFNPLPTTANWSFQNGKSTYACFTPPKVMNKKIHRKN